MDLKTVVQTINQISEEKGIDPERVFEAIENSLAAAYRREYLERSANVRAKLNKKSGEAKFFRIKEVVDETTVRMEEDEPVEEEASSEEKAAPAKESDTDSPKEDVPDDEDAEGRLPRYNPERHILLEDAKKEKKTAALGDEIEFDLPPQTDFGRIAAQNAKQVILQSLREAERESIVDEYEDKEGKVTSGVVQRFERGNVYVDLGRTTGVMFSSESIPGEHYRVGDRLRFYVLGIQRDFKGPGAGISLSRSHPGFVSELFAMEIPEITDGVVEIKEIVREPGSRTKIAVASNVEEVDPVGSCVGQRGTRIMAISNELGQEKIDVVEWSEDQEELVANALSPAKIKSVDVSDDGIAKVLVADDQLSLAIGRGGQNVRLAAKLTNLKIDVRSQARPDEEQEGGVADVDSEATNEADIADAEEEAPVEEKTEETKEEAEKEADKDAPAKKEDDKPKE